MNEFLKILSAIVIVVIIVITINLFFSSPDYPINDCYHSMGEEICD